MRGMFVGTAEFKFIYKIVNLFLAVSRRFLFKSFYFYFVEFYYDKYFKKIPYMLIIYFLSFISRMAQKFSNIIFYLLFFINI